MLDIQGHFQISEEEFSYEYARSGGPGGQNVNKVNSKVTLRWNVKTSPSLPADVLARLFTRYAARLTREGELLITSQRFRDRERNRADCLEKLQELLEGVAVAPKKRRATRPTRGSKERRLQNKQREGQKKRERRNWSREG